MTIELSGYELSRSWFNFCFEHPEKINPNHTALFFFCIEHCNRLGWKKKFGLPTTMAKEAIGIKSYNTYIKSLNDLVEFGFIIMVERSKNQYSSNIIALSKNDKAHTKALDKAFIKHGTKQSESTEQSISSVDKPLTIEPLTINHKPSFVAFWDLYDKKVGKRGKVEKKWNSLQQEVKEKILDYIPKYKKAQPEKKYRKNPETFLNNESWEDELIGEQLDLSQKPNGPGGLIW